MSINKAEGRQLCRLSRTILAIALALALTLSMLPTMARAGTAISYIGVSSDIHGSVSNVSSWLASNGSSLEYMVFGGDNAEYWSSSNISAVKNVFSSSYASTTPVFTMGNHDWFQSSEAPSEAAFLAATGNTRTGVQNSPATDGYTIYTFGAASSTYAFTDADIANLTAALGTADTTQPFFIISHYPLHYSESRTITNATKVITLLNNYPNVFFFWGHNHHSPDSMMGTIKVPGDTITAADTQSSAKLKFTYCNSGHMGTGNGTADTDGTGVVVEISDEDSATRVNLSFKEKDGTVLTTKSVLLGATSPSTVIDSVEVTGITAPVAGVAPDTTATVSGSSYSAGAVTWSPSAGTFAAGSVYTASVTLTASDTFAFSSAPVATVNGSAATDTVVNEDGSLTVSYTFPATVSGSYQSVVYKRTTTITSGNEYVVVLGSVAMDTTAATGSSGTSTYTGLSYVTPIISGDYLTFASDSDAAKATWIFTSAGTNAWNISSGGKYVNATANRTVGLSTSPQAWTYGTLSSKGTQLYTSISSTNYNLCYGGTTTVDMIYPSANTYNTLTLYEKIFETVTPIDTVAISDITAPSTNSSPDTAASVTGAACTVGAVSWSPAVSGKFVAGTVYTASVTLTPAVGYEFNAQSTATVNGNTISGKTLNSGGTMTVTYEFPATDNNPYQSVVYKKTTTITSGNEYVVVLGSVAMNTTAATGTSGSNTYTGLSYVTPIISGEYLTFASDSDAAIATWIFTSAGTNAWNISNGGKYVNATANRTVGLSTSPQAWTYGTLSTKGTQLYTSINSTNYNLFYGGTTTVNFVYPSANNNNTLTIYEKIASTITPINTAAITIDAPVWEAVPDSSASVSGTSCTAGTVTWNPTAASFAAGTVYTASVTLTPVGSNIFTSLSSVTINGEAVTGKILNSNGTMTVTYAFPATEDESAELQSVCAVFSQGSTLVFPATTLSSLKPLLAVTAHYSDGTTVTLDSEDYDLSGTLAVGTSSVTVTFSGETTTFNVSVTAVALIGVNITDPPTKTNYFEGEFFDSDGMVISAVYNNGDITPVTTYSCSPAGALTSAVSLITISYGGLEATLPITVSPVTDTTVSAISASTDVNAGEIFTVKIKVTGDAAQTFASFSTHLGYDEDKVAFTGFSAGSGTSNASASDNTATNEITVLESGASKTIGTEGFIIGTLSFRALTSIETGCQVASFAISDAAIGFSGSTTPALAALSGADLNIKLHNHTVSFGAGVGNTMTSATAYVKYNLSGLYTDNSYSTPFVIPVPLASAGYRLADKLWGNGTDTYTSAEILNLAFTVNTAFTARSVQASSVSFYDVNGTQLGLTQAVDIGSCATAPSDPSAPAGMSFVGWFLAASSASVYDGSAALYDKTDIDAAVVTADTIYKAYCTDNEYAVTLPSSVEVVSGVSSGKVKHGTDLVFTVDSSGFAQVCLYSLSYRVGSGSPVPLTADGSGNYTVPGTAIVGAVTIQLDITLSGSVSFITHDSYKGAPTGYKLALLSLSGTLPSGTACFYDSNPMFFAAPDDTTAAYGDGVYVYFVASGETAEETLSKISLEDGAATAIRYRGDVNGSGAVEINDAQLVYDLYNNYSGYRTGFVPATMLMRLEADVNGDGTVGIDDIRLIYSIICGIFGSN